MAQLNHGRVFAHVGAVGGKDFAHTLDRKADRQRAGFEIQPERRNDRVERRDERKKKPKPDHVHGQTLR